MSSQSSKGMHGPHPMLKSVTTDTLGTYLGEVQAKIHIHLYIIMKLVGRS